MGKFIIESHEEHFEVYFIDHGVKENVCNVWTQAGDAQDAFEDFMKRFGMKYEVHEVI